MNFRLLLAALMLPGSICRADPLTLERATALALRNQPALASQQANVDASRELAPAEGSLPDPKLTLGVTNIPTNNFSVDQDFMTMRSVGVEQMFPDREKLQLKSERAGLESELAAAELGNLRRAIRRDARLAWLGVYYPQHASNIVAQALRFYEQQKQAAEIALRAGRAGLAESNRIQVEIDLQRDRQLELGGQARKARAELARWIGGAAQDDPADLPEQSAPLPALATLRERVLHNPQLVAAHREIALAENDVAQARAAYRPDWSLGVMYSKRGPQFSDMVSVQVGIDLPVFTANRQDRRLASKMALQVKHEQQHEDHRRMLLAETEGAYATAQTLAARIERYDREILPQAAQRVEATIAGYRAGRSDLASVIEARRAETDLELQRLALRVDQARVREQIDYLAASPESKP